MNASPRWLTPEQQAAWDGFIRMQEKLIGRLARNVQADSHMSAADFIVLAKLTEAGGRMRFMDLTKLVEWEKSRMSHQVGRMVKRGLVAKEECPDDGRGSFVVATPAGYEAIEGAAPCMSSTSAGCSSTRSPRTSWTRSPGSRTVSSRTWRSSPTRRAGSRPGCLLRPLLPGGRTGAQPSCALSHRRTAGVTRSVMSANSSWRLRNLAT